MNTLFARSFAVSVLLLGLSACGTDTRDLEKRVSDVKDRKSTAIEPIPVVKQFEAFVFDAAGRRDPFTPVEPQRDQKGFDSAGLKPDLNRNKEPLEEFPLDALRMMGVIETGGKTFAMVKAPDGVIHRVTVRDHIGQNYGEIIGVTESEITLTEIIPDGFGGWMQRPANLALAQ